MIYNNEYYGSRANTVITYYSISLYNVDTPYGMHITSISVFFLVIKLYNTLI